MFGMYGDTSVDYDCYAKSKEDRVLGLQKEISQYKKVLEALEECPYTRVEDTVMQQVVGAVYSAMVTSMKTRDELLKD